MEPVRLGVIGCGVIGRVHLGAARQSPWLSVVAVADVREQAVREAAAQFGVGTVYSSADALLDDPRVEAVVVAMPAFARTTIGLQALARGRHLLTEKPVAMNAQEVESLIRARGSLVAGCCSSRFRHLPSAQAAADFIGSGALGDVQALYCRVITSAGRPPATPPPAWRLSKTQNGGGILMNWGCYDLDYLFGLTGWSLQPETVLAQTWPVPPQFALHVAPGSDAETRVLALARCRNGAVVHYERAEYAAAQPEATWQIAGSRGTLHLQMTAGRDKRLTFDDGSIYDAATDQSVRSRIIWCGDEEDATYHVAVLEDFARAVRGGHSPKTSLEQALLVQRLTDAIYASATRGIAVRL